MAKFRVFVTENTAPAVLERIVKSGAVKEILFEGTFLSEQVKDCVRIGLRYRIPMRSVTPEMVAAIDHFVT